MRRNASRWCNTYDNWIHYGMPCTIKSTWVNNNSRGLGAEPLRRSSMPPPIPNRLPCSSRYCPYLGSGAGPSSPAPFGNASAHTIPDEARRARAAVVEARRANGYPFCRGCAGTAAPSPTRRVNPPMREHPGAIAKAGGRAHGGGGGGTQELVRVRRAKAAAVRDLTRIPGAARSDSPTL